MLQKRRRSHPSNIQPSDCLPLMGAPVPSSSHILALEGTPSMHMEHLNREPVYLHSILSTQRKVQDTSRTVTLH